MNPLDDSAPQPPTIINRPASASASAMSVPPSAMENYVLGAEIARGGMGCIMEAADNKLKRTVAVKLMLFDASADRDMHQRFLREAEVLAQLAHPNIVPVYDIVWDEGVPLFYTMKRINGRTLQAILHDLRKEDATALGDFTLDRLLLIFRKVCDALAFAHSKGIIHRDLKPENVMIGEFGEVLVMDWGIAKVLGDERRTLNVELPTSNDAAVLGATMQGSVMGTPQYMSPEQARGEIGSLDERSDIFSLGGILYAILTLRPPVEGVTLDEVLKKVTSAQITSPSTLQGSFTAKAKARDKAEVLAAKLIKPLPHTPGGRVPAALSSVVMKALRLDQAQRYQSVAEFSADIEAYQAGFATKAEEAGPLKQLKLLMLRHKAVTASLAVMLLLSIGFVLKVMASERKATHNAEIATANERRANENAEQTRRALKTSQIAVADAAVRAADLPAMVSALDSVPEDLRDQSWDYLSAKRDASLGEFKMPGFGSATAIKAIPGKAGKFAVATSNGAIGIVDARSGKLLRTIDTPFRSLLLLAVSADGQTLAVTMPETKEVRLYRVGDGSLEKVLPYSGPNLFALILSPDARQLVLLVVAAAIPKQGKTTLIDTRDGSVLWKLDTVFGLADFTPDGRHLVLGSDVHRSVAIVEVATGKIISSRRDYVTSMAMSRDGSTVALGLYNGDAVLVEVATGRELRRARLHRSRILGLAWTARGSLLTIGAEGVAQPWAKQPRLVVRLWDSGNFAPTGTFFGIQGILFEIEFDFNPSSGDLLVKGSSLKLWRVPVDVEVARLTSDEAEMGLATVFLSDTILLGRANFSLMGYDVANPGAPKPLPLLSPGGYTMVAIHRPSEVAAFGRGMGTSGGVSIYSTRGGAMVKQRDIPFSSLVLSLDFDPEGGRLLAASAQNGAFVFEVSSGKTLLELPQKVSRAVFVGTGKHVAAIVAKKRAADELEDELTLLDATSGKAVKSNVYPSSFAALAVSEDRKLIAIGGTDQIIRVLNAETLEESFSFRAHDAEITALAFHPRLPVIASGSADGSVKLWNYETAKLRESFVGFAGQPVMLAFSPNGRLLSAEGFGRFGRLFDLGKEFTSAAK